MASKKKALFVVSEDRLQERILLIRGQRVMVDADLAGLYGVSTKRLNEQIKRNQGRFPADFMFRLKASEKKEVVAKCDHLAKLKFSSTLPFVFTEHGALMVASVLNTRHAIDVSVFVVRAFVKFREMMGNSGEIRRKFGELEKRLESHDASIASLIAAIRQLMQPAESSSRKRIGF